MFYFESPNRSDQSHTLQLHRWTTWNKHMTLKSQGMFSFFSVFWRPAWRLLRFNMRPYSLVEQLDTQKFETLPPPKEENNARRYGRFCKMKWKVVSTPNISPKWLWIGDEDPSTQVRQFFWSLVLQYAQDLQILCKSSWSGSGGPGKIRSDQWRKSRSNPVMEKSGFQVISCLTLRAKGWLLKMESLGPIIFSTIDTIVPCVACTCCASKLQNLQGFVMLSHFKSHTSGHPSTEGIILNVFKLLSLWNLDFSLLQQVSHGNSDHLIPDFCASKNNPKQLSQPRSAGCSLHFHLLPGYQGSERQRTLPKMKGR